MKRNKEFILVEPIAKTSYPPLGLMKIGSMLRNKHRDCKIFTSIGTEIPSGFTRPSQIYITSLFTWDLSKVVKSIQFFKDKFPKTEILVGGIAASLLPGYIKDNTGINPHIGLLAEAEGYAPDYSLSFNRKIDSSITFTSRGCPRKCNFCSVRMHEPEFFLRKDWEKDIFLNLPRITFWDNNWLASRNFVKDCEKIKKLGKTVDFNQGLDARLYNEAAAKRLSDIRISPLRFAFDNTESEGDVIKAIQLAKKYSQNDIRVYVLYNYTDTPEDFYHRISTLNRIGVLAFPMEYRKLTPSQTRFPGPHWDSALLRALKLSLIFYYRKGMITESRESFKSIYGKSPKQFISKLYDIYEYDKKLKR